MDTVLVGSEVPRVDGLAKVTGKAVYGDDITMNNMLYGVCRYVDIPALPSIKSKSPIPRGNRLLRRKRP